MPNCQPTAAMTNDPQVQLKVQDHAIRAHFYASVFGDHELVSTVEQELWALGFTPEVFKKVRKQDKAKGVDIAMTKDLLSHAYSNNYDVAVIITADQDFIPVILELKRLGKVVYLCSFAADTPPKLRLASDRFFDLGPFFKEHWHQQGKQTR
jgi:uncharacterized LabA/DUF88 family protein